MSRTAAVGSSAGARNSLAAQFAVRRPFVWLDQWQRRLQEEESRFASRYTESIIAAVVVVVVVARACAVPITPSTPNGNAGITGHTRW
eukprot:CAMPEP_0171699672 /NCGR_PEP_ID=MMETSP0991-20121206/10108_1 /TAXON_ID=483369 /ORGANISM="non described non described, Strain CCMP2098" /LENGTH=87 /DNA_ID=CAMNT_0012288805 /DNA_START=189 /DNA_END=452 /DNA_ORIENTATION=+